MRHVHDVQAIGGSHEKVAELHLAGSRIGDGNRGQQTGLQWIIKIEHDDAGIGGDVERGAGNGQMPRTIENAVLVPGHRPFKEIVARFTVAQRGDIRGDQAFYWASVMNAYL